MVLGVQLKMRSWMRKAKHEVLQVGEGRPYAEGLNRRCACKAAVVGSKQKGSPGGCGTRRFSPSPLALALATVLTKRG